MPLQGRKPFQRLKPPKDLRPDEELFYCKITHEVFREYDQFFDRVILCNSLVWTCSLTGKSSLTFQEALESEKNARATLRKFPEPLKRPLFFLGTLTKRGRLNDMCDDVYTFAKDRYFVGEVVEVLFHGEKKTCTVTKVVSADRDRSPSKTDNKLIRRSRNVTTDKLKYEVQSEESGKTSIVQGQAINRIKGTFTKATNKLVLKHNTISENGVWKIKNDVAEKYNLQKFEFKDICSGPLPKYAASPTKKKVLAPPEKKRKSATAQDSGKKTSQGRINFKKDSPAERAKLIEREQEEFEKQRLVLEAQRQKRRDETKRKLDEEKERLRALKLKEKEQKKEEQRKMAEYLNSWKQPRDDLECDDLKDLPKPTAVECSIPQALFGDALMILEFVSNFGGILKLKDFFPSGFTLEHLEKVLVETDIQGCFNDLLQLLLTSLLEWEDLEEKLTITNKILNPPELNSSLTLENAEKLADATLLWPKMQFASSLSEVILDSFSLTEILRLHILRSGSKHLVSSIGLNGYSEDPGLRFKIDEWELVKKLGTTSVFQLNSEERMKILALLVGQLSCCDSFCSHIEKNFLDSNVKLRLKLKELRFEFYRQQKEDALNKSNKENGDKTEDAKTNGTEVKSNKKIMPREEFLREEAKLKQQMEKLKTSFQGMLLGRDRAFRRYWYFSSVPGIFVENDDCHVGPCLAKETLQVPPNSTAVSRADGSVGSIRKFLQHLDEGKNGSSDKENDILQDLAIIQNDFSIPLKGRKLSDLNTRVDNKKSVMDKDGVQCVQCREKAEIQNSTPWFCPHSKPSSVFGLCTAFIDTCSVHNLNAPRTKWSFFHHQDDLEALLSALNSRGFRESSLRKTIVYHKDAILQGFLKCPVNTLNLSLPPPPQAEVRKSQRNQTSSLSRKSDFADMKPEVALEVTLRESVLELESRIYSGSLGSIKHVGDRDQWRERIASPLYKEAEKDVKESDKAVDILEVTKEMSEALHQIFEGIEFKFLKPPLGPKTKGEGSSVDARLSRWKTSVLKCTSLSQVYIHLGTLERSIMWSRSALKARCRICRRGGDAENMLLCDQCNRGHHLYCLKPPLEEIPKGDWFCVVCHPPEKVASPRKTRIDYKEQSENGDSSAVSDSDEEDDEEEEEDDEEEAEDEQEEVSDNSQVAAEANGNAEEMVIEVCECCGGTGTVICCDKCPKVYHPECIGLRRIPRGEWLCPACTKTDEAIKKTQKHSPSGKYGTRAQSLVEKVKTSSSKSKKAAPKIQIRAVSSRKRKLSTDSESEIEAPPPRAKSARIEKKVSENNDNPFKKVYNKDSTSIASRRRSKSSVASDMLDYPTCLDLLVELMHHPSSWPFMLPVSKRDAPSYHLVVKRPMDFGTIRSNLNNMSYRTNDEFLRDIFLVLQNCEMFNPRASLEYQAARTLHLALRQLLEKHDLTHTVQYSNNTVTKD